MAVNARQIEETGTVFATGNRKWLFNCSDNKTFFVKASIVLQQKLVNEGRVETFSKQFSLKMSTICYGPQGETGFLTFEEKFYHTLRTFSLWTSWRKFDALGHSKRRIVISVTLPI